MLAARLAARPLHCYLLLSLWICLLVAGMYKYIITVENVNIPKQSIRRDAHRGNFRGDLKLLKIVRKFCNNPDNIRTESEGLINNKEWALQGVITVIRHGDRGPLTHVRDIESVNCDSTNPSALLQKYQDYINNATGAGRAPWAQSPGPFHNFPLLPSPPSTACRLGQLTLVGIHQLLTVGELLGRAYATKLGWNTNINPGHNITDEKKVTIQSLKINTTKITGGLINDKLTVVSDTKNKTNIKIHPKSDQIADAHVNIKNNTKKPLDGEIIVHSTRYRRALQSGLALIWAMLGGNADVGGAVAHESPSLAFCSTDCACPAADKYAKIVSRELKDRLETHPAIGDLVTQLSKIVSQSPSQISNDPHILEDALLAYLCHSAPLPCVEKIIETPKSPKVEENTKNIASEQLKFSNSKTHTLLNQNDKKSRKLLFDLPDIPNSLTNVNIRRARDTIAKSGGNIKSALLDFDSQMEKEKLGYYQQKLLENADSNYQDVILVKRNMDGDFNFNGENPNVPENQDTDDSDDYEDKDENKQKNNKASNVETLCVRKDHVTGLFAYTDWEMKQSAKSKNLKKVSLLRAYGMIRHIVQYILRMVSEGKPKFILYSGHDKTLQYLSLALGLTSDNLHIQYASRITIEIYKSDFKERKKNSKSIPPIDFYFRIVMNGQDVTNQLIFCRGKIRTIVENEKDKIKAYLCKIENIIRFIHEDYFSIFNVSNFKDACAIH